VQVLAEPTVGDEESSTAVTVAGGTDGGSSTSNPIGSTLIRPSSVTHRAISW